MSVQGIDHGIDLALIEGGPVMDGKRCLRSESLMQKQRSQAKQRAPRVIRSIERTLLPLAKVWRRDTNETTPESYRSQALR